VAVAENSGLLRSSIKGCLAGSLQRVGNGDILDGQAIAIGNRNQAQLIFRAAGFNVGIFVPFPVFEAIYFTR